MNYPLPSLVSEALDLAEMNDFTQSCTAEVGRLLNVLTRHQHDGIIGEVGTGYGVGTAWMATALQPSVSLITVEADPVVAAAASDLLGSVPAARVLCGDWRDILAHGPFDLLFVDAAEPKCHHADELVNAQRIGGMIVLDDFTPLEAWPDEWRGTSDPVRELWLHHPRLTSVELHVSSQMSVIVATRS